MLYFSERLKSARKMKSFSLQSLSDALDNRWNKQYLNRLETGEAIPDVEVLSALSKALGVTMDYFAKEAQVNFEEVEYRKLKKLPVKEQDKVIYQTKEVLESYIELENYLGISTKLPFKLKSYIIEGSECVEDAAEKFRKDLGLGTDAIYKVVELLENIGIKVIQQNFDVSFSGMSTVVDKTFPVIVLNDNEGIPLVRKRFTSLHELAHLYLNLDGYTEKEAEKLCDRFASALLLPKVKVFAFFGIKRTKILLKELQLLASDFGISMAAILYRCMDLGIISPSYYKYYMINYNKYNTRLKEFDVFTQHEKSDRFLQLLMRAVAEEVISISKAASLNNQKLGDFRDLIDSNRMF